MTTAIKPVEKPEQEFLPKETSLNEICLSELNKEANIKKLKKELSKELMPEAKVKDDEGYILIKEKLKLSTKARTGVEKTRKSHKAEALAYGKFVDSSAKELTEMVLTLEKPWKDKKEALDNAAEIKAEQERMTELARTEAIELRVTAIQNATANLVGATSDILKQRLGTVNAIIVDESFEEYENAAIMHKKNAVTALTSALAEREIFEAQQEELEKGRRELAEAKAEIEALKANKLDNRTHDELVDQQASDVQIDQGAATVFNTIYDPKIESEDAAPYIEMSEPEMMHNYMLALLNVDVPDVGSEKMVALREVMINNLNKLHRYVLINI